MVKKQNQPKVIIGLLNWNEFGYTKDCINSLGKIQYQNFEIVVLDNGSRDDSVKKLKKIENEKKIDLINVDKNLGFTGGNNKIIEYVLKNKKFDYLLLLNNDTLVEKDFLKIQVNFLEKNSKVGVVGPLIFSDKYTPYSEDAPGKFNLYIGGSSRNKLWKNKDKIPKEPIKVDYISGCSWLIKKEVLKKTKGFEKEYFIYNEEVEWAYRLKKEGYEIFLLPSSKIYHIGHGSTSKVSGFQIQLQTRNVIRFERKYASFFEYIFFLIYLFTYKLPKNIFKNVRGEDSGIKLRAYFRGVYEGLFGVQKKWNSWI